MLSGDYQCYSTLAHDRGTDPSCRLCSGPSSCPSPTENHVHLLSRCKGTADTRHRIMPELLNMLAMYFLDNRLLTEPAHDTLVLVRLLLHQLTLRCLLIPKTIALQDYCQTVQQHDLCNSQRTPQTTRSTWTPGHSQFRIV